PVPPPPVPPPPVPPPPVPPPPVPPPPVPPPPVPDPPPPSPAAAVTVTAIPTVEPNWIPMQFRSSIGFPIVVILMVCVPAVATGPLNEGCPNAVHEVAFSVVQLMLTSCPTSTVLGETVMLIFGATGAGGVMI